MAVACTSNVRTASRRMRKREGRRRRRAKRWSEASLLAAALRAAARRRTARWPSSSSTARRRRSPDRVESLSDLSDLSVLALIRCRLRVLRSSVVESSHTLESRSNGARPSAGGGVLKRIGGVSRSDPRVCPRRRRHALLRHAPAGTAEVTLPKLRKAGRPAEPPRARARQRQLRARAALGLRVRRRRPKPGDKAAPQAPPSRNLRPNQDPGEQTRPRQRRGQHARRYSLVDVRDGQNVIDWFPGDHPPMPDVIAHGPAATGRERRAAAARAICRTARDGPRTRRPAGLPVSYFVRQIETSATACATRPIRGSRTRTR